MDTSREHKNKREKVCRVLVGQKKAVRSHLWLLTLSEKLPPRVMPRNAVTLEQEVNSGGLLRSVAESGSPNQPRDPIFRLFNEGKLQRIVFVAAAPS